MLSIRQGGAEQTLLQVLPCQCWRKSCLPPRDDPFSLPLLCTPAFPSLSKAGWFHSVLPARTDLPWSLSPCHPSSAHSTPLLLQRKEGDPARHARSLSTELPRCRAASRLAKVPSSLEPTMLLCPGGRNAALSLGCPAQGEAGRARSTTNTQLVMMLSHRGREAARRRENMRRTKQWGQAATIKLQYRKQS